MNHVFVLNQNREPLDPVHPAVARTLIDGGFAAILRYCPFTIILTADAVETGDGPTHTYRIGVDPGSRKTGMVVVDNETNRVVFAMEIEHRGSEIKKSLDQRRGIRRSRRNRKCRHRQPRFLNRTRPSGWLPPSIQSRVENVVTWVGRFFRSVPVVQINLEDVKFDTQLLENPDIRGFLYQQGELWGYEVKEFLLSVWRHECAYCGKKDVPLEVEHIVPKSRNGSNRISNLTIACVSCNRKKGKMTAEEFGFPEIQGKTRLPLRDAAVMNAIRCELRRRLEAFGLPVACSSGGLTKFNRTSLEYPKFHWVDAACVGEEGGSVILDPEQEILAVKAMGHGSRQMCRMNRFGFPRTGPKGSRMVHGFRTGDQVSAKVPSGKFVGTHRGRVAVRSSGSFNIDTGEKIVTIGWKYCRLLQQGEGHKYQEVKCGNSSHD